MIANSRFRPQRTTPDCNFVSAENRVPFHENHGVGSFRDQDFIRRAGGDLAVFPVTSDSK